MAAKYQPYGLSFLRYDHELLVYALVAERNGTTDPDSLGLGGRDFVSDPFADDLALELGKGQQHIERERPMLLVVLNDWVTDTNETVC